MLGDGSLDDWTKVKEWGLDIANNGLKEGDSRHPRPSHAASMQLGDLIGMGLEWIDRSFSLAEFQDDLNPAKNLNLVCAFKHKLSLLV